MHVLESVRLQVGDTPIETLFGKKIFKKCSHAAMYNNIYLLVFAFCGMRIELMRRLRHGLRVRGASTVA